MTRLRRDISIVTWAGLPEDSAGPRGDDDPFAALAAHGYQGVQVFVPEQAATAREAGLVPSAIAPARSREEVDGIARFWADGGAESLTLHLGTGFEDDADADELFRAVLDAQEAHGTPILVETHRATLFQDPARALGFLRRYPSLRCTADLSHWYTGVEMVYGDFDAKFEAIRPLFERVRMIHGRISDPGCIQVAVDDTALGEEPPSYVQHFRRFWTAIIDAVDDLDDGPAELPFVVELLPAAAFYARTTTVDGVEREVADRWSQADLLWQLVTAWQAATRQGVPA